MQSKVYRKIRKRLSKKTSRYIGVSWIKSKNKWLASIKVCGKSKNLGNFLSEKEAYNRVIAYRKNLL